jgi:uncharacterized protein YbjT (DUF2867 family)
LGRGEGANDGTPGLSGWGELAVLIVTGPNGNVGSELVDELVARGDVPFRIAAHTPAKIAARYGGQAPAVQFDYGDRATWGPALEGGTTLFLLFPLPHPTTARERMVPFVEFAAANGIEHIIYVSVPKANELKFVPHYHVEQALERSGIGWTVLQASYFAQNLTRAISTHIVDIALHNEIFIPAGRGKTSFVDSRDLAQAALNIVREPELHRGKRYVLTGPELLDFDQVARIFSEELGRPIRYANPSMPRFLWRLKRRGVASDTLFFMFMVYMLTRFGKNAVMTDTLPKLLGAAPRTMRDYVRDYREQWTPEFVARLERVNTPGFRPRDAELRAKNI